MLCTSVFSSKQDRTASFKIHLQCWECVVLRRKLTLCFKKQAVTTHFPPSTPFFSHPYYLSTLEIPADICKLPRRGTLLPSLRQCLWGPASEITLQSALRFRLINQCGVRDAALKMKPPLKLERESKRALRGSSPGLALCAFGSVSSFVCLFLALSVLRDEEHYPVHHCFSSWFLINVKEHRPVNIVE